MTIRLCMGVLCFALAVRVAAAEPVNAELAKEAARVQAIVKKHYPKASVSLEGNEFKAQINTRVFELYMRGMTGRWSDKLTKREGPTFQGFILKMTYAKGQRGEMQLCVPQTLKGPYFPTLIQVRDVDKTHAIHYSFSYGPRLNQEFRKEIVSYILGVASPAIP